MKVREFYRLSNRGYFLSLAALIMFALISLLLMSMMPELIRMLNATKESEMSIGRYIENRNLDERILAIIDINPSFEGSYDFGDSYGSVEIIEKNTVLQSITLSDAIFNVDNATDLTVTLTPGPMVTINNAHLYYEGSIVASLSGNTITLTSNHFYNKTTGETKYGEYQLSIISNDNNNVSINVSYNKVAEREIEIKQGNLSKFVRFTF